MGHVPTPESSRLGRFGQVSGFRLMDRRKISWNFSQRIRKATEAKDVPSWKPGEPLCETVNVKAGFP